MTIWTIKAKNFDGTDATVPDFDDGGDLSVFQAHQFALAPSYASTYATPQTPVTVPDDAQDGGGS